MEQVKVAELIYALPDEFHEADCEAHRRFIVTEGTEFRRKGRTPSWSRSGWRNSGECHTLRTQQGTRFSDEAPIEDHEGLYL